jgi:hypothetical protein
VEEGGALEGVSRRLRKGAGGEEAEICFGVWSLGYRNLLV